ncbi:MAG: hypothetical protein ABW223_04190, partial [Rariglobus sp.]
EVSGNFNQVGGERSITSTGGVLRINGTLNGDNHTGAHGGVNTNGGLDDIILNATGTISITGAVGGITNNGLRNVTINASTTGGVVGDVSFDASVTLEGNLYIKKALNVTFTGNVIIKGDLIIEDAADLRFNSSLTVLGNIRIMKAANVTFNGNVTVSGNVAIGDQADRSKIGSVSFSNNARFDFDKHGGIFTAGAISFGNNVGQSASLRPDSLTLAAGDSITFTSNSSLLLDSTVALVITHATNVNFNADVTSGNVTIGHGGTVTGDIRFVGAVNSVTSLDVTTSGANGTVAISTLVVGTGNATITANNIDLVNSISTTSPTSTLTLKPYNVARALSIGANATGAPAASLVIDSVDLKAIQAGFASVVIGDIVAGTGKAYVGSTGATHLQPRVLNRTVIVGGSIVVTQNFDVANTVDYVRFIARETDITVNGVINRGAVGGENIVEENFSDRNAWIRFEAATNIIINRAVYAADRLSLTAGMTGTGSITVNGTGGNSGLLRTISTSATNQRIELVAGETSGSITLTGAVGTETIRAVGATSSIVLRANGGAISQTGGRVISDTLAVWAKDNVTLLTTVNKMGTLTLSGEILAGGTGAAATATLEQRLATITLINGGSGYTSAPTVTVNGTSGLATATVVGGYVTQINFNAATAGTFLSPPVIVISGGSPTTAATAVAQLASGGIREILVSGQGAGYSAAPTVTILGDGRTLGSGTALITGSVGNYLITSAGSGYTAISALGYQGGGGADASSSGGLANGQLVSVTTGNAGLSYGSAPAISVTPTSGTGGVGANVVSTLSAYVYQISRSSGSGYTYAPTVYISGGSAARVVNGLQMVGTGAVSITNSGSITVNNATTTPGANRGAVNFTTTDGGDITVGYINTSTGALNLVADGAIKDGDLLSDSLPNIVTTALVSLTAKTGIGASGLADLDIDAGSLQATNSVSGDIYVQHAGLTGLTIAGTGVSTTAGNGSVNIQSNLSLGGTSATLKVNAAVTAHGSGNVRLEATGSTFDVEIGTNISITSSTGNISVIAGQSVKFAAGSRVTTTGGHAFIDAANGDVTMVADSLVTATDANIRVHAKNAIVLGGLNAGTGFVSVISDTAAITDAGETHKNIVAGATRLQADASIGAAGNALEISTGALSAYSRLGHITLVEDNDVEIRSVTVTTKRVNINGTTSDQLDSAQSDVSTVTNGNISLTALAGTITLTDKISANGTGVIFLSASANIAANNTISSDSGHITVAAGQSIAFAANLTTGGSGSVDLTATAGSITQTGTASVQTGGGSIRAAAAVDVVVGSFNAGAGNISVTATSGSITDAISDSAIDFVATGLRLVAGNAIGLLQTDVTTLAASSGSGGIRISETSALVVDNVSVVVTTVAANHATTVQSAVSLADVVALDGGSINLTTGGGLTLNKGDSDDDVLVVSGAGSVTLNVTGAITMSDGTIVRAATGPVSFTATGAIALSIITATSGDITLDSGAAITDVLTGEAANLTTSGLATLQAVTGIGATGSGDIDTNVGSLKATNLTSGDIVIEEADDVTVTGISNAGGHSILSSLAGAITATGAITASSNVRLDAFTDIVTVAAISGVYVTTRASRSVLLNTGASLTATGFGTLDVEAGSGSITFADGVSAVTAGGNIRLLAQDSVTLTGINAGTGSVTVTATDGSILNAGDALLDISASSARLTAAIGVGTLKTTLATLAASATNGGISIDETNDLTIGTVAALSVNRVAFDGTVTSSVGDAAAKSDLISTTGAITLLSGGTITLTDGVNADTRAITTTTGAVTVTAAQSVIFQSSIVSTSGALTVEGTAGALVDDTLTEGALLVTTGHAKLKAATGIGTSGAGDIDTTVGSIEALLTTSGGIFIQETDTLTVASGGIVTAAGNSPVSLVVTTGSLTVDGVITAHGSGNIHVNTVAGAATVNAAISSTSGHVNVLASGTITLDADVASGTTGTINIVSSSGSINQSDNYRVRTGSGDIRL